MQPSPSLSSEHGFPAGASMCSAGSPSVIQFVSNIVVGGDGDTLAASLSAYPSTRSSSCMSPSSGIEIEVLFQEGSYSYYDNDCTSPSPGFCSWSTGSFRGCSDGEQEDLEAGRSRLLRTSSSSTEFVERDSRGELRWSASEGFRLSSTSQRSAASENHKSSTTEPVPVYVNANPSRSSSRSASNGIRIALDSCQGNLTRRITEKDIKQAIMFSASLNKLTLSQDEAAEYTQLILEEIQTGQGFIQYRQRLAFEVMGYCLSTAKGAAEMLKLNMAIVLLPVCRNTITWLRRSRVINSVIPFNDAINFHKIRHSLGAIAADFGYHQPSYLEIVASTEGTTGIAMVLLMLIAFLLASSPSRRNPESLPHLVRRFAGFNSFWYSHHVFIAVYVLLIVHSMFLFLAKEVTEKTTWMYVVIPVIIYLGERMFRMVRSMIFDVKILNATVYPGKVLALKVTKPQGFRYQSGMHPFSLTSAPDDHHLSIHIRSLGDWSYQMYDEFQQALLSNNSDLPKISIDGPYGAASQDHSKYEVILLIGLGIGATPFISVLKDIANGLNNGDGSYHHADQLKKAYFYWVTREQGSFEWFRDIMKEVSALDRKQGVIEMYNYLTSVYQEGDKRFNNCFAYGLFIIFNLNVVAGVFYCGPEELGRQLERLCHKMNTKTFTRFIFHKEHF
ncbi:hypothetical protein PR202_gb08063 [Eleusine coracana subsp. coracana]|uniref:FAD-binding FR-type domain-containing protein n=1 Tax=Eleusine coracana subsp. coracana TaxID=191504 RepID=A0AAV5EDP5_ELECO|nr:hypothetical protein PR202_gb08063 [Eleusine coracana subsp. coracana]